jgi:hypothetical protein
MQNFTIKLRLLEGPPPMVGDDYLYGVPPRRLQLHAMEVDIAFHTVAHRHPMGGRASGGSDIAWVVGLAGPR